MIVYIYIYIYIFFDDCLNPERIVKSLTADHFANLQYQNGTQKKPVPDFIDCNATTLYIYIYIYIYICVCIHIHIHVTCTCYIQIYVRSSQPTSSTNKKYGFV